ncbi:MAG: hypothetical protein JO132_04870 [Streptosporangiaceae bacterium]|nr:hypothetical protein [Streptosporangiaceae bacterium]
MAAADQERRRIEQNLHDSAQQQLVALRINLRLARQVLRTAPAEADELLNQTEQAAASALEELRDLAHGIYPPLLADLGLRAALQAQAGKAAVPVTVEADAVGRYPVGLGERPPRRPAVRVRCGCRIFSAAPGEPSLCLRLPSRTGRT